MMSTDPYITDVRDILLADVAIKLQLSPTQYKLAVRRVETLAEWLDRVDSPLRGKVTLIYAQGSMAINATIAARNTREDFDIDAIAQMILAPGTTAQQALDLLFLAIRGEKGSRYYDVTTRNTRCVTVDYQGMHVDFTPAELLPHREPRASHIFHHRPETPDLPGMRIVANPFGFAEWFIAVTPRASRFEEFFEKRSREADRLLVRAAETEDVPEQIPAYLKPPAVVALQLMKRFRNIQYAAREGRCPPSVMIACRVGTAGSGTGRPFAELCFQARSLLKFFGEHQATGRLAQVINPTCPEDVFTDRWPGNLKTQVVFVDDLKFLVAQLARLENGADLETIQEVFARLFGEDVSRSVIEEFADRTGESIATGGLHTHRGAGRVDLAKSRVIAASPAVITSSRAAPSHTFYGEPRGSLPRGK
jgi:hypothetical protein